MIPIKNVAPVISSLRAIKTPEEIECIRKAGDVTIEALKQMLKSARPGEYEYQWAADYEHYVARSGLRHGFETIAASGVVNRSPGARVQQKWWGWMPMTRRVSLNWLCSTWAVKFPL